MMDLSSSATRNGTTQASGLAGSDSPRPPLTWRTSFLTGVRLPTFDDGTRTWRDAHLSKRGYSEDCLGGVPAGEEIAPIAAGG